MRTVPSKVTTPWKVTSLPRKVKFSPSPWLSGFLLLWFHIMVSPVSYLPGGAKWYVIPVMNVCPM